MQETPWLEPDSMLLRTTRHGTNAVTCQLVTRNDWSYELCVVPHCDPSAAVLERFHKSRPAILRHAEVARQLRKEGWNVIDEGTPLGMHGAA